MNLYLLTFGLYQFVFGLDFVSSESLPSSVSTSGNSVSNADKAEMNLQSSMRDEKQLNLWDTLTDLTNDFIKPDLKYNENIEDTQQGRKMRKKKKLLLSLLVGLKVLAAGVLLPSILALALYASWKGVTISLLAFMLAATVGVKALLKGNKEEKHHVIVAKPAQSVHEHIWRKDEDWYEKDHSPYRAYSKRALKQN